MRMFLLIPIAFAVQAPAFAQPIPTSDPVAEASAEVEAHRVNLRVGCAIPVPTTWNAPQWEQQAAARRRADFERCLDGVMAREHDRLAMLARRIGELQAQHPDADWSSVEWALDAKSAELETLAGKLRTRNNWADTAVQILDTFTGPGAPFDTGRSPYGYGPYRRDSSTFAPGIR